MKGFNEMPSVGGGAPKLTPEQEEVRARLNRETAERNARLHNEGMGTRVDQINDQTATVGRVKAVENAWGKAGNNVSHAEGPDWQLEEEKKAA